jgi:hypothetical protein
MVLVIFGLCHSVIVLAPYRGSNFSAASGGEHQRRTTYLQADFSAIYEWAIVVAFVTAGNAVAYRLLYLLPSLLDLTI